MRNFFSPPWYDRLCLVTCVDNVHYAIMMGNGLFIFKHYVILWFPVPLITTPDVILWFPIPPITTP